MSANSLEADGRGPSERVLFGAGVAMIVVAALVTGLMLLKSSGRLNEFVRVVADLTNVGDGLPQRSDVKYHGVLVGEVDSVTPAANGQPNFVHIKLTPQYATSIPDTATARVVPSNVFAVSSVQLVDRGPGAPIRNGAHIAEDTQLPTVLFQTTVSKLRDLLVATGRGRDDPSEGILAAVGAATDNRRVKLLTGGAQLNRLIAQLNDIVVSDTGPSTVQALLNATEGLQHTAPELIDALHHAVKPMQTFVEKRKELTSLINAGLSTMGTTRQALDNHTDQLIGITTDLTPVVGTFSNNASKFQMIFQKMTQMSHKWFEEPWLSDVDTGNMRVNLSLTPSSTYTRADCPRYGDVKGPSCFTAPQLVVRPDMPETLLPQNYRVPPDLQPPRGTIVGPDGNLIVIGSPYVVPPGGPNLTDPNPPLPPWQPNPSPRLPGSIDPNLLEPLPSPPPPIPAAPTAPGARDSGGALFAPSSFGGTVGPVGSQVERAQLSVLTDRPASPATQLLLGPVVRGATVSLAKEGSR